MKRINDLNRKLDGRNSKADEKKSSLFDDSFFEDDEDDEDDDEDDDFDFDEDDEDEVHAVENEMEETRAAPIPPTPSVQNSAQSKTVTEDSSSTLQPTSQQKISQDIQFRLGCELGQVLIPYENLQNLNIGSVVDFNNTVQSLYITVNNVRIGEGMLVDIDGKIGIKITRWYGKI